MIYFTSDTHFAHGNIIEYCGRPFADVEEMNRVMVERWNARVKPDDTVYHLGDFAFGPSENITRFLSMLNGKITLIVGNHDRSINRMKDLGFPRVFKAKFFSDDKHSYLLTHRPFPQIEDMGTEYNLHGHVHRTYARRDRYINVGVDVRGFEPKTLEELLT